MKDQKKKSNTKKKKADKGFESMQSLFKRYEPKKEDKKYITQEFQDYGYRLAVKLNDLEHKGLYIKMAKEENRQLLERALSFVSDAKAKNKGALFMWKLNELKKESKEKKKQDSN